MMMVYSDCDQQAGVRTKGEPRREVAVGQIDAAGGHCHVHLGVQADDQDYGCGQADKIV